MPNSPTEDASVPAPPPAPPLPPTREAGAGNNEATKDRVSSPADDTHESPAKDSLARIARLATSKPPPWSPHDGRLPDLKPQKRFDIPDLQNLFKPLVAPPRIPFLKTPSPLRRAWTLFQAPKLVLHPPKTHRTDVAIPSPALSRTVTHKTGIHIASLDISPDRTRAVLAGREILKIIHVTPNSCTEEYNVRAAISSYAAAHGTGEGWLSAAHRENLAANDAKWSHGSFDRKIAIAAANGRVVVFDLDKAGLEWARLHEHNRQVHRLAFNPFEGGLLLSGSQDATVRLWDLRFAAGDRSATAMQSKVQFAGNSDVVRDVRWSPTNVFEFAMGTDTGMIQRWDIRKHSAPLLRTRAHEKACHAVDWHPDGKHLVSAGADKDVKVWDFASSDRRIKPLVTLRAPHPIVDARWRPRYSHVGKKTTGVCWESTQLATILVKEDPRVIIWDLTQPNVPHKMFDRDEQPSTCLLWRDNQLLWSATSHGIFTQIDTESLKARMPPPRHSILMALKPDGSMLCVSTTPVAPPSLQDSSSSSAPSTPRADLTRPQFTINIDTIHIPPLELEVKMFRYFATNYRFQPTDDPFYPPPLHTNVRDMLLRNAFLAKRVDLDDVAVSWEALAYKCHKELLARAELNSHKRLAASNLDQQAEDTNSANSLESLPAPQFLLSDFSVPSVSDDWIPHPLSVSALLDSFCEAQLITANRIQDACFVFLLLSPHFNTAGAFTTERMLRVCLAYRRQLQNQKLELQVNELENAIEKVFPGMCSWINPYDIPMQCSKCDKPSNGHISCDRCTRILHGCTICKLKTGTGLFYTCPECKCSHHAKCMKAFFADPLAGEGCPRPGCEHQCLDANLRAGLEMEGSVSKVEEG